MAVSAMSVIGSVWTMSALFSGFPVMRIIPVAVTQEFLPFLTAGILSDHKTKRYKCYLALTK